MKVMGIRTTVPAVKNHISPKTGKRIDCNMSNYVPFVVPGLSTSSSSTPTLTSSSSSSQDSVFDVNRYTVQYQKEVEVRVKSCGETRCINRQKPKTNIQMKGREEVQSDLLTGCRISEKIWSMNVVLQRQGETLRLGIETLPVLLMNYQMEP